MLIRLWDKYVVKMLVALSFVIPLSYSVLVPLYPRSNLIACNK